METPRVSRSLAGYAALVRVPNLFTAPPDVLAGAALAVAAGPTSSTFVPERVFAATVVSVLVYAGGTTLNDYFDAPVDAVERPTRPIPSGRVPRSTAGALGAVFLGGGVLIAFAAGRAATGISLLLVLTVLLYDGALKGEPEGYTAMGVARGLNVALGAAAVAPERVPVWLIAVPVATVGYIAAVTAMADAETTGGDRRSVAVVGAGAVLAAIVAIGVALVAGGPTSRVALAALLAIVFLVVVGRPLRRAYHDPTTVGLAVASSVLGLVVFDAAVAATAGAKWALVTLAFLVPAIGLSKAYDVT